MTTLPRKIAWEHCPVYEPGKGGGCKCGADVHGQAWQEHVVEVTEAAVRELVKREREAENRAYDEWAASRVARGEVTP